MVLVCQCGLDGTCCCVVQRPLGQREGVLRSQQVAPAPAVELSVPQGFRGAYSTWTNMALVE